MSERQVGRPYVSPFGISGAAATIMARHRLVLSPEEEFAFEKGYSEPAPVVAESPAATGSTGS